LTVIEITVYDVSRVDIKALPPVTSLAQLPRESGDDPSGVMIKSLPRSCGDLYLQRENNMSTRVPKVLTPDQAPIGESDAAEAKRFCLLYHEIISINYQGETRLMSLPEAYAALAENQVDDFPGLRPHQKHFWHATLCQIGAIAMVNEGIDDPPVEPEVWLQIIRNLTVGEFPDDEPWHLSVEDYTKPAFLQPAVSSAEKRADYKGEIFTPDEMDLPVGSKHHDIRNNNMRNATAEQWLFALVAKQTGGGYDGNRLFGSSRMNSGSGNRHGFSLTPSTRWGAHVSRDLQVLVNQHRGKDVNHLLLWTRPWDGGRDESLPLQQLAPLPLYVEVSRRIRLEADSKGSLKGRYATSRAPRIHAKEANGMTHDPWTITETEKSVTVSNAGFDYRQTSRYLDPTRFTLPSLARHVPTVDGDNQMHLVARAIVRGQGKTEGYHERTIPLGRGAARMFGSISEQARLHRAAQERLNIIAEVQSILSHAVKTYLQDGVSDGKTKAEHQKLIAGARRRVDQAMDPGFWTDLQEELESADPQRTKAEWCHQILVKQARDILNDVVRSGLCHGKEQYRATAEANDLFGRRVSNSSKLPEIPEG